MLTFEDVFTHQNLIEAGKRIKQKNRSCGLDGMTADEGYKFIKTKYKREVIIRKMKQGKYVVHKSKVISIKKKDSKKKRTIKIQTMVDRIVLDCLATVLNRKYGHRFSKSSFAYKNGVGAHTALKALDDYYKEGYVYALSVDLKKYFDNIPQSLLMNKLDSFVDDRLKHLIHQFIITSNRRGVPQGNPVSPFLSNLFLDPFDKRVEGLKDYHYIRYADDILILSKKPIEEKLLDLVDEELKKLKIKRNKEKTVIGRVEDLSFLGMIRSRQGFLVKANRIDKFEKKVDRLLNGKGGSDEIAKRLDEYIAGWMAYYHLADIESVIESTTQNIDLKLSRDYKQLLYKIRGVEPK